MPSVYEFKQDALVILGRHYLRRHHFFHKRALVRLIPAGVEMEWRTARLYDGHLKSREPEVGPTQRLTSVTRGTRKLKKGLSEACLTAHPNMALR